MSYKGQGQIKIIQHGGEVTSVVLSMYELNPKINEKALTVSKIEQKAVTNCQIPCQREKKKKSSYFIHTLAFIYTSKGNNLSHKIKARIRQLFINEVSSWYLLHILRLSLDKK